jgi:hypothetical protein
MKSPLVKIIYTLISIPALLGVLLGIHLAFITHGKKNIDPVFQPIYQNFLTEANQRGLNHLDKINISITFTKIDQTRNQGQYKKTLGECHLIIGKNPEIKIDQGLWSQMSYAQQEMTIFHELGHCFLLKGHTDTHHGLASSLMNSFIFNDQHYLNQRTQYLDELFSYQPYHAKDYVMTFFISPAMDKALSQFKGL